MNTTKVTEVNDAALIRQAIKKIDQLEAENRGLRAATNEPAAVIGLGCRFPGIAGPEAFWTFLQNAGTTIREIPDSREGRGRGGFFDSIDRFDPAFFGITPAEAKLMDPQQRFLLEVCWETIEFAGCDIEVLRRTVFLARP